MDYIYQNLDKDLTVEEIANHCCFSKYYFNRIFKSVINESLYAFIKRLRLEYAAFKLRTTRRPVTEIALEAGYSPSNFATAFKDYFGINATEYRKLENFPVKDSYRSIIEEIKSMKKQTDFFAEIDSKITIWHEFRRFSAI
jgi:AraC family transcriptional regulator